MEAEVVQLALAIAAKILHREAQVDPMLVAALVRMAMEKMREGSSVTVRVQPGDDSAVEAVSCCRHSSTVHVLKWWRMRSSASRIACWKQNLGSANFGLDTQLKEVEQGFFDLLALRPVSR